MRKEGINSREYWDGRFEGDWTNNSGPAQSRFFSKIALENLPKWLFREIRQNKLSVVDWGCAQGDGTDELRSLADPSQLTGVDFSDEAIKRAEDSYGDINFLCEDWLAEDNRPPKLYDVVFSSNTLEHFSDPYNVLDVLCDHAKKAVVLALPYEEDPDNRIDEHFYTFSRSNISVALPKDFRLVWSQVVDCQRLHPTYWSGSQIFLIYISDDWCHQLDLSLENCELNKDDSASSAITPSVRLEKNHSMAYIFFRLLRRIHRLLPPFVRRSRPVIYIRNLVRKPGLYGKSRLYSKNSKSISWKEFSNKILAKRDTYKGIFIQEFILDWNALLFQRPQQIAIAMGLQNYLVIYKTDPSRGIDNVSGFQNVAENVWITDKWKEVDRIKDVVRSVYSTTWPANIKALRKIKENGILIYEYIDHMHPEISSSDKVVRDLMDLKDYAFDGGADYIVVSSKMLYDEAVEDLGEGRVIMAPNGVDVSHYRDEKTKSLRIPRSLREFKLQHSALVGFFGSIGHWLWHDELVKLVKKRPDLGFVFIGPDYLGGSSCLPTGGNVLYLGAVDHIKLPAYASQFDICLIPFKPGDIAKATSPVKLFEYFALEKPVVVTSEMDECTAYPEVFSGDSAETLSDAIDEAIKVKDDDAFKARMAQLADENTWIERAKAMSVCFGD